MKKIIHNRIRCRKCGGIIESEGLHHFVTCRCGAVSADGGRCYLIRLSEKADDFEELSEFEEQETG